jgi:DNA ligase-1
MLAEREYIYKGELPLFVETKYNGVRTIIIKENGNIIFLARSGIPYENFKTIEKELHILLLNVDNVVLDGEIFGISLKEIMEVARRKDNIDDSKIKFRQFDYLPLDEFRSGKSKEVFIDRRNKLTKLYEREDINKDLIFYSHGILINTKKEFEEMKQEHKEDGQEGVIGKILDGLYEMTRSKSWIKFKNFESMEVKIIGFKAHKKNRDCLGSLICRYGKNKELFVGTGFLNKYPMRKNYTTDLLYQEALERSKHYIWQNTDLFLGKYIEIKYLEKSKNTVVINSFIRIRWDLDDEDFL